MGDIIGGAKVEELEDEVVEEEEVEEEGGRGGEVVVVVVVVAAAAAAVTVAAELELFEYICKSFFNSSSIALNSSFSSRIFFFWAEGLLMMSAMPWSSSSNRLLSLGFCFCDGGFLMIFEFALFSSLSPSSNSREDLLNLEEENDEPEEEEELPPPL